MPVKRSGHAAPLWDWVAELPAAKPVLPTHHLRSLTSVKPCQVTDSECGCFVLTEIPGNVGSSKNRRFYAKDKAAGDSGNQSNGIQRQN